MPNPDPIIATTKVQLQAKITPDSEPILLGILSVPIRGHLEGNGTLKLTADLTELTKALTAIPAPTTTEEN